jgi:hypothetical protein
MTHVQAKFELATRKYGQQQIRSPKPAKPAAPPRVPHVAKLMALAIRLEHLIETGQIADQAEIARTAGITRARVTQILNLNRFAPDIQQAILNLEPTANPNPNLREGLVRQIATEPNWAKQRRLFRRRIGGKQDNSA